MLVAIRRKRRHHRVVFNFGPAEVIVMALLALICLGPRTVPDVLQNLGRTLRLDRDPPVVEQLPRRRSHWLLVGALTILAAMAIALARG